MAAINSGTLAKLPRRMRLSVISRNHRSTLSLAGFLVRRGKLHHELAQRGSALPPRVVDPVAPKVDSRDGSHPHPSWVLLRQVPPSLRRMGIPPSTDRAIPPPTLFIK